MPSAAWERLALRMERDSDGDEVIWRRGLVARATDAIEGASFEENWPHLYKIDRQLVAVAKRAASGWRKLAKFLDQHRDNPPPTPPEPGECPHGVVKKRPVPEHLREVCAAFAKAWHSDEEDRSFLSNLVASLYGFRPRTPEDEIETLAESISELTDEQRSTLAARIKEIDAENTEAHGAGHG